MSSSCCIYRTAKPCRWCWWPAACELPVSCPARQPPTPQMTRWPTGRWCATVLDQMTAPLHFGPDCILVTPNRTTLSHLWRLPDDSCPKKTCLVTHTHTHTYTYSPVQLRLEISLSVAGPNTGNSIQFVKQQRTKCHLQVASLYNSYSAQSTDNV